MKKYYNNDERYGDCGPFGAESREALADEMEPTLREWAIDEYHQSDTDIDMDQFVTKAIAEMRTEFISGLEEVE